MCLEEIGLEGGEMIGRGLLPDEGAYYVAGG